MESNDRSDSRKTFRVSDDRFTINSDRKTNLSSLADNIIQGKEDWIKNFYYESTLQGNEDLIKT